MGITDTGNLVGVLELLKNLGVDETVVTGGAAEELTADEQCGRTDITRPQGTAVDHHSLTGSGAGHRVTVAPDTALEERTGGDEHQVVVEVRILPGVAVVVAGRAVAEDGIIHHHALHLCRIGAEHSIGMLDDLLILMAEEVITGCKSVSGIGIEVILGSGLEIDIAHILQTDFKVFTDFLVDFSHVGTVVVLLNHVFHFGHVRHTDIVLALLATIGLGEEVDEHEVRIGTEEMCLSPSCTELFGEFCRVCTFALHGLHSLDGMVDTGDGVVVAEPYISRRVIAVVRCRLGRFELEEFVVVTVVMTVGIVRHDGLVVGIRRQVRRHVIDKVVARNLTEPAGSCSGIGRNKETYNLVLGIDFRTLIGRMVKKIGARACCDGQKAHEQGFDIFHVQKKTFFVFGFCRLLYERFCQAVAFHDITLFIYKERQVGHCTLTG